MSKTKYWDQRNNAIYSSVGHWQGGVDVTIEGHSLVNKLIGNISLMQLNILNATGKLLDKTVSDWIEINFMGLSYPDSRIWCNQISSYAGDLNTSVVAAASASILSSDSRAYGGSQTTYACMAYLKQAYSQYTNGLSIEEIISSAKTKNGKPIIVGFARPIDRDDERLIPYQREQKRLNIPKGEYLCFAYKLSDYLFEHFNLSINSGGYASAFLLDQNLTPQDGYNIKAFAVIGGAIACYRNLANQPTNSFLPMRCDDIDYIGPQIRTVPD